MLAFAWTKLGLGDAIKDIGAVIQQPPPPSCPAGEAPRFFEVKNINGREVGPGWVCLPVDIKRL